jgi:hypothetical protein
MVDLIHIRDEKLDFPVRLCEGENVKIVVNGETRDVYISAPVTNKTNIKHSEFMLTGDYVEIEAGRNIIITSTHPNKLTIGADFDKDRAKILALEERIINLEKAVASILKGKK